MKYAGRTKTMKASEIRELLKYAERPGFISFGGGMPSPHSFPLKIIDKIADNILRKHGAEALQYSQTEGVTGLREALAKRAREKGIKCKLENIIVTAGSQQALDLAAKIFLDIGNYVVVELPTYMGALTAFNAYQPRYISVSMDDEGMLTNELEEKLKGINKEDVDFVYTVPTFQNPSGVTLSMERRKHLLEIAEEHDLLIIEDDAYSDLRYSGKSIKSMKSIDKNNRVIYTHTLSKTLAPGFRLGYVIADVNTIKEMTLAKQGVDICTNTFAQHIAAEYIKSGLIEKQLVKIKKMYKEKRDIMLRALEKYFPEGCIWACPEGGMFIWVTLPSCIDTNEMIDDAIKEKVLFVNGAAFRVDGKGHNNMRLNFTNTDNDNIEIGIKRLAKIIRQRLV